MNTNVVQFKRDDTRKNEPFTMDRDVLSDVEDTINEHVVLAWVQRAGLYGGSRDVQIARRIA